MPNAEQTEKEKRAAAVRFARASAMLEGFKPSAEDLRLDELYIEGKLTSEQLRCLALERHQKKK